VIGRSAAQRSQTERSSELKKPQLPHFMTGPFPARVLVVAPVVIIDAIPRLLHPKGRYAAR
jgi:hypothetical protein